MQSFLDGAALSLEDFGGSVPPDLLYTVGQIWREALAGTMKVLVARSRIKSEFRMDVTFVQAVENNPLKLPIPVDDAMLSLLKPKRRVELDPITATRDAYADIQAHQMAVMAGMRNALQALLKRFHPEALDRRLNRSALLDTLLPQHRKARNWDQFNCLYQEIIEEAEDDFESLFGDEFRKAYEEQSQLLKAHSKRSHD